MDSPRTHLLLALAIFLTFVCPLLTGLMNFTEVAEERRTPGTRSHARGKCAGRKLADFKEHLEHS